MLSEKEPKQEVKTILVVEDDRALNKAIILMINKRGFNIVNVTNGEDGLKALEERPDIALIWLDILLPRMNGFEFLERLRKSPLHKDKKVVVVSASGGGDDQDRARKLGAIDYLVKSDYDIEDLVTRVTSHVYLK